MKIALHHVAKVPPKNYGGIERVVYYLGKGLVELGHSVVFIGPEGSHIPGAEIINVPDSVLKTKDPNFNNPDIRDYIPYDADLLHVHYYTRVPYNLPILKTIHGYPFNIDEWWGAGFPRLYDKSCVFLSDAHRRTAQKPNNPYVYNGIDVNDYWFSDKKEEFLLFLARVDWTVKGVFYAIEVAKLAGVPLIIAGNIERKGFYEEFKKHLGKNITYVGPVGGDVKKELLSKAMALIFPTLWPEPFGLVVIEALASGTPVLTTYLGAMPEIIAHGKVGFMSMSINQMAKQVKKIETIDPHYCRRYVEMRFNYIIMAKRYEKLYEKLVLDSYACGNLQPCKNTTR